MFLNPKNENLEAADPILNRNFKLLLLHLTLLHILDGYIPFYYILSVIFGDSFLYTCFNLRHSGLEKSKIFQMFCLRCVEKPLKLCDKSRRLGSALVVDWLGAPAGLYNWW